MAHLALFFFGPPKIEVDSVPIKLNRHKAMALLAYLAITPQHHSRNTLATLLWPNQNQSRARAALRRVLVTLNKSGIGQWLIINRDTISLQENAEAWIDTRRFHQLLTATLTAQSEANNVGKLCIALLTEAVGLYTGDFLAGFTLRDSPEFDEWQLAQTESLRYDLGSALARLVRCYSEQADYESAIGYAQRWLNIDPLYELAHRQLMQLYAWNNQQTAALRQFRECAQILKRELGVEPSTETTNLYQRIRQGGLPQPEPPNSGPLSAPLTFKTSLHNFPAQPTLFVGRKKSLADIIKRLKNPNCRLLTLVGPGGIGKTRLAIQAAIALSRQFSDGLYFVSLASVSSPDSVVHTIAQSIGLSVDGETDPHRQLFYYVQHKDLLLVLDNFEHLLKNMDTLLEILQAPNIKVLVTSRERLNLQGEWTFDVKGLSYPPNAQTDNLEDYSAVALFLQRACRVNSDFALTPAETPHILQICRRVAGMPLALELAASWVRVLSCAEIAKEIEHMYTYAGNLDFLATPLQDVPRRHQSLRLVFEHSWQLLSVDEQRTLRQLSVFKGGCTREAIEAVTGASLFLVSALVDKSLLTRNTPQRYELHEILRQFAAEKLQQTPQEAEETQNRHCDYYASFLHQREATLRGEAQKETLAEIAAEIENIRGCWRWAVHGHQLTQLKKATESLWYFYAMYGRFREGTDVFETAVTQLQSLPNKNPETTRLEAQLLTHQGWFLLRQGYYEQANTTLERSNRMFESLNDTKNSAAPIHHLGVLAGEVGELEAATDLLRQSLAIYKKWENPWGTAWTLSNLAYRLAELGPEHYPKARQLLKESLGTYQTIGNKQGMAVSLNNLGYIAYLQGDYATAKTLLQDSLVLRREAGYPRGIAVTLNNLGHVTGALGDYPTCQSYYLDGLKLATTIQAIPLILAALGGLAVPLANTHQPEQALELLFFVLHHSAANKETQDRATAYLTSLKSSLPPEIVSAIRRQVKEQPRPLDDITADLLEMKQDPIEPSSEL